MEPKREVSAAASLGAEEGLAFGEDAGVKFSQNRVWLMWPPALKLMAIWRWSWDTISLFDDADA